MKIVALRCGNDLPIPSGIDYLEVSAIPTRAELKPLDAAAAATLPVDPTPSLAEIAAQPDVHHLGAPDFAPQPVADPLRVIVVGTDAALAAVLTRMMRGDYLWAHVGFVPVSDSTAARAWGLPSDADSAWSVARSAPVRPLPLIRTDAGLAVAGSATISAWGEGGVEPPFTGEIIVDNNTLVRQVSEKAAGGRHFGARLVPMLDAPGVAAVAATGPQHGRGPTGLLARLRGQAATPGAVDAASLLSGRAVQAGGPGMRVVVDGVSAKRPVDRVTFYRHLRDLQAVRP